MLKVENSDSSIAIIQDEIRRNPAARYEHRLHAVLLVAQGMSCVKTAELLGDSVRSVEEWVKSFNQIGLQALYDLPVPGRPSRVPPSFRKKSGRFFVQILGRPVLTASCGMERHCPIGLHPQEAFRLA